MLLSTNELDNLNAVLPMIGMKVNTGYKKSIESNNYSDDMKNDPILLASYKRAVANYNFNIAKVINNDFNNITEQQLDDLLLIFSLVQNDIRNNPGLPDSFGKSVNYCYITLLKKRIEKYGEPNFVKHSKRESSHESSDSSANSGGCFIATAVYGDYDHPQVLKLREYRDQRLSQTKLGRYLIRFYYKVSPGIAQKLNSHIYISNTVKSILNQFIKLFAQ